MKKISIEFKSEKKFEEGLQKLDGLDGIINSYYTSYNYNTNSHSIDLYIGGELIMVFADYTEEGIYLSICSDVAYYSTEEQNVKHIDENVRLKGIRRYTIT